MDLARGRSRYPGRMDELAHAKAIDRIAAQLRERVGTRMVEHTLPIHVVHGEGHPSAYGSGVLLRVADVSFLLSCAHVLKTAKEDDTRLLIPSGDGTPLAVLGGVDYRWTEDKRIDLGFAVLPNEVVALIPPGKSFLRVSDLDLDPTERVGVYNITGYPIETTDKKKSNIDSRPLSFTTYLHPSRLDDHLDGITIALRFEANATGDLDGELARMPHLKGMSGCGIWRLADMDRSDAESWSPDHVKLVGIEHGFVRGAIKGSYVAPLIDMIRAEFPALRDSIDLHRS
jgi:hypothetical protein